MCEGDVVSGGTLIDVKAYGWCMAVRQYPMIPVDALKLLLAFGRMFSFLFFVFVLLLAWVVWHLHDDTKAARPLLTILRTSTYLSLVAFVYQCFSIEVFPLKKLSVWTLSLCFIVWTLASGSSTILLCYFSDWCLPSPGTGTYIYFLRSKCLHNHVL